MRIPVCFCFDERISKYVNVAIYSLLSSKNKETHYDIICVGDLKAFNIEPHIRRIISAFDKETIVNFINVNNIFSDSYEIRDISVAAYLRLMLPQVLPNIDKVIYLDVDVLVNGDLTSLWQINIDKKLILGVKDYLNTLHLWANLRKTYTYLDRIDIEKSPYINSGVLLMNLQEMRQANIMDVWKQLSKNNYFYQDQDIINLSCQGSIGYLPLKYNRMPQYGIKEYDQMIYEKIVSEEEVEEAWNSPMIIHFAGEKPWKNLVVKYAYLWWRYAFSCVETNDMYLEDLIQAEKRVSDEYNKNMVRMRKNALNYQIMLEWMKLKQHGHSIQEYLFKHKYNKVAIYGMNRIGFCLYEELKTFDTEIFGIDNKVESIEKPRIYKLKDNFPQVDLIIVVAVYSFDEILLDLQHKVTCKVVSINEIIEEIKEKE